jgi:ubiquinone/menaquinone biosynthesis C-methylase UbiE
MNSAVDKQQRYYEKTATEYDSNHLREPEHEIALAQLLGIMQYHGFKSLLDVGAGTGRVLRHAKHHLQGVTLCGIEPVAALRDVGYSHGLAPEELREGNALHLDFSDNSWDVVCAFGILHHIKDPEAAITEMCRVARYGVFFSDLNNYGCGSLIQRSIAQSLRSLGLWRSFQFLKNGGKFEKFSEGDGLHYSYSLFDSLPTIRRKFPQTYIMNTKGTSDDLYRSCPNISVFAAASEESLLEHR